MVVDFGTLREGCTYCHPVELRNTGVEACRFRIKQPPPSTAIKAVYTPGPVSYIYMYMCICSVEIQIWFITCMCNVYCIFIYHLLYDT